MTSLYQAQATAIGGRIGSAATSDGKLRVQLSTPKELGGPGGEGTNPEQLFAAGYAACFLSAIKLVAGQAKVALADDSNVTANVGIGPNDAGQGFRLAVSLSVDLPGIAHEAARGIVDQAHLVCPYSNATRGNIDVEICVG